MTLKNTLLESKVLYGKSKKDVRFLKEAVSALLYDYRIKGNDGEDVDWISEGLAKEFEGKISTLEKNEKIGALVSCIVNHGADVLSTIKTVAEWLCIAETTVRDGYYKIRNVYGIDPKTDPIMECRDFRLKHGRVPLEFMRDLYQENRIFPGDDPQCYEEYKRVVEAMRAACETAWNLEQRAYEVEMNLLKMILGDTATQKISA